MTAGAAAGRILAGVVLVAALGLAPAARAQEVTVTSGGGGVRLTGRVLGYDGRYLRLATEYGEVTLDYDAVACAGAACPDPATHVPTLRLSGARRMGEVLLPALVEAYARDAEYLWERTGDDARFAYVLSDADGPVLRLEFRLSTSEEGFADLLADEADIALSVREIRGQERRRAREVGLGDLAGSGRSRIVALDALVPVSPAVRDLHAVDLDALARTYAGEVVDWSDLGGDPGPLVPHLGPVDGGRVQDLVDRVLAPRGLALSPGVVDHPDDAAVARAVTGDPAALGVVGFGTHGNARPLALGTGCRAPIAADPLSIKTEDYPLTAPLFLYLPARRLPPAADALLDWLRSGEAQMVVRRAGFVDRATEAIPLARQGDRLANAVAAAGGDVTLADLQDVLRQLDGMDRLTTTFRFDAASSGLDAQSRSNIHQLAREIRDGRHDGRRLALVGFTDGVGGPWANLDLGSARAAVVRDQILAALGGDLPEAVTLDLLAFGEAMPIGCDTSGWGRRANRRVELWSAR